MINRIIAIVDLLCKAGAGVASVIMLLVTGHILLEITLRSLFHTSTFVVDEFVGYGVASMTFLALAHALNRDSHIRVSLLSDGAPVVVRQLLELFAILVAITVWAFVTWYIGKTVWANFQRGVVSETIARTPLWLPQATNLVGLLLLLIALLARALRAVSGRMISTTGGDIEHH